MDVRTDEIRGAQLFLKSADRDLRARIARETRARLNPLWRSMVRTRAARDQWTVSHVQRSGASVGMTMGGRGTLRYRVDDLSGGYGATVGESKTLDHGTTRAHGRRGQLPAHKQRTTMDGAVAAWAPAAARLWLWAIADECRDGLGVD